MNIQFYTLKAAIILQNTFIKLKTLDSTNGMQKKFHRHYISVTFIGELWLTVFKSKQSR